VADQLADACTYTTCELRKSRTRVTISRVDNPDYFGDAVREFLGTIDCASPQTA